MVFKFSREKREKMQVRRFEELVKTGYIVQNCVKYLGIGSQFCHDLVSVDVETMKIKTSSIVRRDEPRWERIINAIENLPREVLKEILTLDDTIENPLPVFMWRDNQIQETQTEDYEWPNTDNKGFILYVNLTFKTEKECAEHTRNQMTYEMESIERYAKENIRRSETLASWISEYRRNDNYLTEIESKYKQLEG